MICGRLVVGVYSEEAKENLFLHQPNLTLQKATEILKVINSSPSNMSKL